MQYESRGTYLPRSPLRVNTRVMVDALWAQIIGLYWYFDYGICRVKARINNHARKVEWTPRITDGHQKNLKTQQSPRAGQKGNYSHKNFRTTWRL